MRSDQDLLIEALLEEWFDRAETGEIVAPEVLCREHPELLSKVTRILYRDSMASEALAGLETTRPGREESPSVELTRLGEFTIESKLGTGGTGDVYLARQVPPDRWVALKVLRPDVARDQRALLRFRREAEIAARLEHPNMVPVFAVGQADGLDYIAMKRLSGPSLDRLTTTPPPTEVARIGIAVARALHEAHEAGVIHRDVKPGNIMLDNGVPFVLDFGLARSRRDVHLTETGTVAGTVLYMSPEQLRAGHLTGTLDARTDVYSLGATLYHLLKGVPPFSGDNASAVIGKVLMTNPPRLTGVDRDLETIVLRALEKDRDRRFPSAGAFADDLERYLRGDVITSRRAGPLVRIGVLARRHRAASVVIGVLLLVMLILAGFLIARVRMESIRRGEALQEIEQRLGAGDLVLAKALLSRISKPHATDPLWSRLARGAEALGLMEDLMDDVQGIGEHHDVGAIGDLIARIERVAGLDEFPVAARTLRLLQVYHALLRDDQAGALAGLKLIDPGRDTAALGCAATLRESWDLPEETPHGAVEHVVVLLVARWARRPDSELLAEVRRAKERFREDYRVRFAELVLMAEMGVNDEAVLVGLSGILREGRYRRSVVRAMIRQSLVLGRTDEARTLVTRFEARWPEPEWESADAAIMVEARHRLGEPKVAELLLGRSVARWPRCVSLQLMAAVSAGLGGDHAGAEERLRCARADARLPSQRERVALASFSLEAGRFPEWRSFGLLELEDGARERLDGFRTRVRQFAREARLLGNRAEAGVLAARASLVLGEFREARREILESMRTSKTPSVLIEFAAQAFAQYQGQVRSRESLADEDRSRLMTRSFGDLTSNAREARTGLKILLEPGAAGPLTPRPDHAARALHFEAALAFLLQDYEATEEAVARVSKGTQLGLSESDLQYLGALRRMAARATERR